MSDPADDLIQAYLAGDLDAVGIARFEAWLRQDVEHQRRFMGASRLAFLLHEAVTSRVTQTTWEAAKGRGRRRRTAGPRSRLTGWGVMAAAALALLVTGRWILAQGGQPRLVVVLEAPGPGSAIVRAGVPLGSSAGMPLAIDDVVQGPAILRFPDGSDIAMDPGSTATLSGVDDGSRLRLTRGRIEAQVAHQPTGHDFSVTAPFARIRVIGTRFTVDAETGATRIAVSKGRIWVHGAGDSEQVIEKGMAVQGTSTGLSLPKPVTDRPRTPTYVASLGINCGGPAVGGFRADGLFHGGSAAPTGWAGPMDTRAVNDPVSDQVLRTQRHGTDFSYTISGLKPSTRYRIMLYFSEDALDQPGDSAEAIAIDGRQVLDDFDIRAAAGAVHRVVERAFTTVVNPYGSVMISFWACVGPPHPDARIDAIAIQQQSGP